MAKIIAFVNQKGGVGKTTSCLNIGAALARKGKLVLLIDADPQGNLTTSAGVELDDNSPTIYEVLKGSADINSAIYGDSSGSYAVIPTDIILSGADMELSSIPGREVILKENIARLQNAYDYILIDCPPSLSLITYLALTAATGVIIPVQAHYLALNGVAQLYKTIQTVKNRLNPQLEVSGVILTMYDPRKILNRDVYESLSKAFPGLIFDTTISSSIALAEAPSAGKDIFAYKPYSKSAEQYDAITDELIERG